MTHLLPIALSALAGTAICWYARRIEPRWLDVQELFWRVPELPPDLDGLRIAQLSDIHVTLDGPPPVLERALDAVEAARVDLVVLTGDLVHDGPEVDLAARALVRLGRRPTFAVFGNHDYNSGARHVDRMVELLRERGIRALRNEVVCFERGSGALWILGLDDPCTGRADATGTLASLATRDHPRLLLTHSAETVEGLEPGAVDLALAGHTHGGQIYVPFLTATLLGREFGGYSHGRYTVNDIPVYVNRGLGSLGIEARFLRRPEVTIFTLRSGGARSELAAFPRGAG